MQITMGLLAGLIFGIGLIVSGMADPAKVLNFLDVAGAWDPSLAFVMGGASLTAFVGYRLVWRRGRPLTGGLFDTPPTTGFDMPLITGSAIFGIGWGIGGFCPGPAWTSLAMLTPGILVFLPAMLVGLAVGLRVRSAAIVRAKGAYP